MKARHGFTLVEMLVVMIILAMVAAIAIPTAGALTANYGLAGDQARFMSTLSQARALAIRHNICYSVVFNNIDPDSNWYTIIQHRADVGSNSWNIDGKLALLDDFPLSIATENDATSTVSIANDNDAKAMAGDFLMSQVGPRRQMQPGVRIGAFRPEPVSVDPKVAEQYWCMVKPLTGDWDTASATAFSGFDEFMRNGIALGIIQFKPTGEVNQVAWADSVTESSGTLRIVMKSSVRRPASSNERSMINLIQPAQTSLSSTHPQYYTPPPQQMSDYRGGGGTRSSPNFINNARPFLATGAGATLNYIVIGLTAGDRDRVVRDDGAKQGQGVYWGSSGPHVAVGIHKLTGSVTAKNRWAPEDWEPES